MFINDFHLHLNGSFSIEFLKAIAEKKDSDDQTIQKDDPNAPTNQLLLLCTLQEQYREMTREGTFSKESIGIIWRMFACVHNIIQTAGHITAGVVDVVKHSTADYLEIRSTPRALKDSTDLSYIEAFVAGLEQARKEHKEKTAYGILSLDRAKHTKEDALKFIDAVVAKKEKTGLLVGIDISGNPAAEQRTITDNVLETVIKEALTKKIGIAIHIGEYESPLEERDSQTILDTLSEWKKEHKDFSFAGKVRLGHGIHLTPEQRKTIKDLEIPLEVCPACHEQLKWWDKENAHPATLVHDNPEFTVPGTDDSLMFARCDAKKETEVLKSMWGQFWKDSRSADEIIEAQTKYRFGPVI